MTSLEFAKELNIKHFSIIRLIALYRTELEEFGEVRKEKIFFEKGTKGGRPFYIFHLNEVHKKILTMLLKNNKKSVENKIKIMKELLIN